MITYSIIQYSLREKDMQYMQQRFAQLPAIEKVILYGSRATGDFEKSPDIDLAVISEKVTFNHISHLHYMLENESPTLLWFDVLHYNTLKNKKLKQSITDNGVVIYESK